MRPIRIQKAEKNKKKGNRGWILSPGVSVSGSDLYAGLCIEG